MHSVEIEQDRVQEGSPGKDRVGWAVILLVLANVIVGLSASTFGDGRVVVLSVFVTLVSAALVLLNAGLRR